MSEGEVQGKVGGEEEKQRVALDACPTGLGADIRVKGSGPWRKGRRRDWKKPGNHRESRLIRLAPDGMPD